MRGLMVSGAFAIVALLGLALALSWRSVDQQRLEEGRQENCLAIEVLKAQLRPEPFDVANTRRILRDLNIDPDSATGERLLKTSRADNERERAALAPTEC